MKQQELGRNIANYPAPGDFLLGFVRGNATLHGKCGCNGRREYKSGRALQVGGPPESSTVVRTEVPMKNRVACNTGVREGTLEMLRAIVDQLNLSPVVVLLPKSKVVGL